MQSESVGCTVVVKFRFSHWYAMGWDGMVMVSVLVLLPVMVMVLALIFGA